ncbi:bestrophin-like domain [Singulisphaera rosea]
MSSITIALVVFACAFGGSLFGVLLRTRLPEHQLNPESKEVIKLAVGILGTLTGMVLGLLVASAKGSFDSQQAGIAQLAGNVITLDRTLAHYGPEAKEIRELLRVSVTDLIERTWPSDGRRTEASGKTTGTEGRYEVVFDRILALGAKTDAQRTIQAQALKIVTDTGQMRWSLYARQQGSSIPFPFLVVLIFWLTLILGSFGLFAPRNATALLSLAVCAAAISCAIFLILELDRPFVGIIRIPSDPLRAALEHLGR